MQTGFRGDPDESAWNFVDSSVESVSPVTCREGKIMDSMISPQTALADLTVILVTYNSAHCIPKLADVLTRVPHVIIVDNASNDGTAEKVSDLLPNATLLANDRNMGFGAANNVALKSVQTSFALLLNPDTAPDHHFFLQMIEAAHRLPEAAIIAPQLVKTNGTAEVNYRWPTVKWKSSGPAADGPCCVGFVCGAAMLFNMEKMTRIGFFDEDFFLYYEDEDLSQRAFMQDSQIVVMPDIRLVHVSRGSVKGERPLEAEFLRGYHHAQSKLLFEEKHLKGSRTLRWRTLSLAFLALPFRLIILQPKYLARLLGRIAGLTMYRRKT